MVINARASGSNLCVFRPRAHRDTSHSLLLAHVEDRERCGCRGVRDASTKQVEAVVARPEQLLGGHEEPIRAVTALTEFLCWLGSWRRVAGKP